MVPTAAALAPTAAVAVLTAIESCVDSPRKCRAEFVAGAVTGEAFANHEGTSGSERRHILAEVSEVLLAHEIWYRSNVAAQQRARRRRWHQLPLRSITTIMVDGMAYHVSRQATA